VNFLGVSLTTTCETYFKVQNQSGSLNSLMVYISLWGRFLGLPLFFLFTYCAPPPKYYPGNKAINEALPGLISDTLFWSEARSTALHPALCQGQAQSQSRDLLEAKLRKLESLALSQAAQLAQVEPAPLLTPSDSESIHVKNVNKNKSLKSLGREHFFREARFLALEEAQYETKTEPAQPPYTSCLVKGKLGLGTYTKILNHLLADSTEEALLIKKTALYKEMMLIVISAQKKEVQLNTPRPIVDASSKAQTPE